MEQSVEDEGMKGKRGKDKRQPTEECGDRVDAKKQKAEEERQKGGRDAVDAEALHAKKARSTELQPMMRDLDCDVTLTRMARMLSTDMHSLSQVSEHRSTRALHARRALDKKRTATFHHVPYHGFRLVQLAYNAACTHP